MRRPAASAAALVWLMIAGLVIPAAKAEVSDGPALVLSKSTAKLGEYIGVTGTGFPAGARLQVEICGLGGSSNSCAIAAAVAATTDAAGGFHQALPVVEPPTPCPCPVLLVPWEVHLCLSGRPARPAAGCRHRGRYGEGLTISATRGLPG